jgi:ectoine hydroxylase-related dioxygenase (phytanoyl-CoA dioxygenase family)
LLFYKTASMVISKLEDEGFIYPINWVNQDKADTYKQKSLWLYENTNRRVLKNVHLFFSWALEMVEEPTLINFINDLLGDCIAVENTFLMIKPPKFDFYVPPHQDGINHNILLHPMRAVSVWAAITDATESNGCLKVYPSSHHQGYVNFDISNSSQIIQKEGVPIQIASKNELQNIQSVVLQSGQSCVFNVCLVHHSEPNYSDDFRIGINIRYVTKNAFVRRSHQASPLLMVSGKAEKLSEASRPLKNDPESLNKFRSTLL